MGYRTINCRCFAPGGICTHQAAPRAFFGPARCIEVFSSSDPRISKQCQLKVEILGRPPAPPAPPAPPKKRVVAEKL